MEKYFRLIVMAAVCAVATFGQTSANKAQIVGSVLDASGAVVAGAAVKVTSASTGLGRETVSNEAGQYRFVALDPGTYTLTASSPGLATATVEGIVLNVGASAGVDVTLQVEEATTTVEVAASLIQVAEPAPMTGITDKAIQNLPINGRRFQDFATLTPTVQIEPVRSTLSFVGQRGVNSNIMLDGGDYNNPFFGGIRGGERANLVPTVPQSAVEEFQVVTTGYNAEYGRSTGGIMNVITKSGGNDFHGNAFWLFRDGELSLKDPIFDAKSAETQHQFGGAIGGPIRANRLFFFAAAERQDNEAPREVLFSRLAGFTPTPETQEAFDHYKSLEEEFTLTNDATALTGRMDYQTDAGNRLTLRYNFSDARGENAVNTGGALQPFTNRAVSNDGVEKDRTHTGTAQYTHIFSPALLNDLRFTGTYELRPRLNNSDTPEFVSSRIGTFGGRSFLPTTQNDKRFQIADALSWTTGAHTLKAGLDYNYVTAAQTFGFSQFGAFSIAGSNEATLLEIMSVGGPTPDRLDSPAVTYNRQIGNLLADMSMHQLAFFAQDSWRISPKLTLDFGLRWEGQYNPQPEATNTDLVNLVKGYTSPLGMRLDPTQIPDATDQWMPRFGFAWTPKSSGRRVVVRGHTGIFYATSPLLLFADASNNFRATPGNLRIFLNPTSTMTVYDQLLSVGVDLNQFPLNGLPVLTIEQVQQAAANARGTAPNPFLGAGLGVVAPDFRNPRSWQGGIGVDAELTSKLIAGVQFNYVNTVHLQRNRNHNLPPPILRPDDASQRPFFGLRSRPRPLPTLGDITVRESSARSMYRGVTFSGQYRSGRLTFGSFYTWSESFSDDDNERSAGGFDAENQFNLIPEYGYSRIDGRHQFTSYAVGDLPWGFQLSGSFAARSGWPLNPTAGTDANEDFQSFSDRAFEAPGRPFVRNAFYNRSVVTNNSLRVLKSFNLTETVRIQLSAEFFNLLNLDNVVFGSSFGDEAYGLGVDTATGAVLPPRSDFMRLRLDDGSYDPSNRQIGSPFQAQFGLRFLF